MRKRQEIVRQILFPLALLAFGVAILIVVEWAPHRACCTCACMEPRQ